MGTHSIHLADGWPKVSAQQGSGQRKTPEPADLGHKKSLLVNATALGRPTEALPIKAQVADLFLNSAGTGLPVEGAGLGTEQER